MGGACYMEESGVALHAEMLMMLRWIEQHAVGLKQQGTKNCTSVLSLLTP